MHVHVKPLHAHTFSRPRSRAVVVGFPFHSSPFAATQPSASSASLRFHGKHLAVYFYFELFKAAPLCWVLHLPLAFPGLFPRWKPGQIDFEI